MKCYELKLYFVENGHPVSNAEIIKMIETQLNVPNSGIQLKVQPKNSVKSLIKKLNETFECDVRESISDGCYGARPGTSSKGLTLWMHPKHLTDRYLDADLGEMVNPWFLLTENGTLVESLDGETFEQYADELDLEVKSDNTYNFNGHSGDDASFMFDFQFSTVETKNGGLIASIMFHCGGDPRGNYTNKFVFKFKYVEDFYSVIFPSKLLTEMQESEA